MDLAKLKGLLLQKFALEDEMGRIKNKGAEYALNTKEILGCELSDVKWDIILFDVIRDLETERRDD
jgi:hypothetical protein